MSAPRLPLKRAIRLKHTLLAHHSLVPSEQELLRRDPGDLLELLDDEPRKGLQRLEMRPTARWRSFALQLLKQEKKVSSGEPKQSLGFNEFFE